MADSATTRKRLRKQSLGSNTNTWGDTKLNEVLDVIDQSVDGYEAVTLTGDMTLVTTNYSAADQAKYRYIRFTGALPASASVTFPSVEGWYFIRNASGAAVTCKLSGSTGVTLANGDRALIFSNGTDFENIAPTTFPTQDITFAGKLTGVVAGTAATHAVNKTQMESAIAAAAIPGANGTVKVDASATADYLINVLTASGSIVLTDNGNTLDIGFTAAPTVNRVSFFI